ncbi:MAG: hypothetical protein M3525_10295, partial [Acidobacteriota bacterium]|nr:hypothetical protein [Acidobacteriota bacterium]
SKASKICSIKDPILLPSSKASIKTKNKSANSSDFVELISSKMNWATVSDPFWDVFYWKLTTKGIESFERKKCQSFRLMRVCENTSFGRIYIRKEQADLKRNNSQKYFFD